MSDTIKIIEAQKGFQEDFLSSPADIVVGGGSAGAGKSYAMLLDPLGYIDTKGFGAVIFRRTTPQIRNTGSLWDTSFDVYSDIGGTPRTYALEWKFPNDTTIRFAHLEYEKNKYDWSGSQIPYIGFDELQQFTKGQFIFMLSRNRSTSGVKPCIRATCNPDPDSWLADFIAWWIDQKSGFPIAERAGKLRYFTVDKNVFVWGDTKKEVIDKCPHIFNMPELKDINPDDLVKSVTFIPGSVYENRTLLEKNPAYLSNLLALSEEEQMRLLKGNWKIRQDGSSLFNYNSVNDIFTNFIPDSNQRYITCDYARFGSNWTIIKSWVGWLCVRIEIMTKSSTVEAYNAIENERERLSVPRSNVAVDEDGVGGGVVDLSEGEYVGFHAGSPARVNPNTGLKENYKNFKNQCYYYLATKVNTAQMGIRTDNIIIDGVPGTEIELNGEVVSIVSLIKKDLRAIKKKMETSDGARQINSKEEQTNILGGRSPDFSDALMFRSAFDLEADDMEISFI